MAKLTGDYKKTETYKKADPSLRKQYDTWMKSQKLSHDDMYRYLLREDMRALPKETIRKGNSSIEMMVISAMAVFLVAVARRIKPLMLAGAIFVIITSILYFSGILNPYTRTIRACTKKLKQRGSFTDFKEWKENQK